MSLYSQLQSAASFAQNTLAQMTGVEAGETNATLAGVALVVVADTSRRGEDLMMGGRIVTLAMTASATRDQAIFDTVTPTDGMAFVYDGTTYKVLSKEKDALHWRLILGHGSQ